MVDKTVLHGLSCKKSAPRHIGHAQLNDIIWRAVKRAQYPSVKGLMGLSRSDGKRLDGVTLIPWTRGKPIAWDITVADTYANSCVDNTATREAAAADRAASSKTTKYTELSKTHHFTPIAIEKGDSWNDLAIEFINELGKRITAVTQEPRETQYIFQRMSVALQRGNAFAFQNTFLAEQYFFAKCRLFRKHHI